MKNCKWIAIGVVWATSAIGWIAGAAAQDPFATPRQGTTPADPVVTPDPVATSIDPTRSRNATNALIVKQLVDSQPQTAAELLRGVRVLMDLDEIEFARTYLERLSQMRLEDSEWFRASELIGADFLMRLYGEDRLLPANKELVRTMNQAGFRYATSAERVDQLIRGLSDESQAVRSESFRHLRRMEQAGAVALLQVFADSGRQHEYAGVREALRGMGPSAVGPLLAASRARPLQMRYEALMALALRVSPECFDAVVGALFSPHTPQEIKDDIQWALQQTYEHLPDRDAIERMHTRTRHLLFGQQLTADWLYYDRDAVYVNAWIWDGEAGSLVPLMVAPETAARMLALDRAADLHRAEPNRSDFRELHLLAFMDANKRVIGPDRVLSSDLARSTFPDLTIQEIEALLHLALDRDMIPAVAAACDLLAQHPDTCQLLASSERASGLIRTLHCGDRHAQFAAFRALVELDCREPFAGCSHVMAAAAYFSSFADRPSGLIGHHYPEIAQSFADVLRQTGISGRGVENSRDMYREAVNDANLRYLFLSDTLAGPGYNELLQQFRSDWRTKRLPAAILVRSDTLANAQFRTNTDAFTLVLPETLDPTLVALQVDQLRRLQQPWEVTTTQGRLQAEYALNWILKVLADSESYSFYEVLAHQRAIADLLYWPHNSRRVIEALGWMGTAVAQRELIEYASQTGLPIENRQLAVESFAKAISRRGIMLTREEILQQYDRYNASAGDTGENQRVLGLMLDLIEAHSGR